MGTVVALKRKVWITVYNEASNQFLLARRSKRVNNSDQWNVFGGGVNPDEDLIDAADRELLEETGIRCNTVFERQINMKGHLVYYFRATFRYYKIPTLNYEHDSFGWFSREAIQSLPLHLYTHMYFAQIPVPKSKLAT